MSKPHPEARTLSADDYNLHGSFVSLLGIKNVNLLGDIQGKRVLDLGCGDGKLTAEIIKLGARVVGVDIGQGMVEKCLQLGIDARVADARNLPFESEFDAVFSNATLHWIRPPEVVLQQVRKVLKPGGRFAGEFGGFGNIAAIQTAIRAVMLKYGLSPADWPDKYFPTADEYRELLESNSFIVQSVELVPRPTKLDTDMDGWLKTFGRESMKKLGNSADAARAEMVELLRPSLQTRSGVWYADYSRLRFCADVP